MRANTSQVIPGAWTVVVGGMVSMGMRFLVNSYRAFYSNRKLVRGHKHRDRMARVYAARAAFWSSSGGAALIRARMASGIGFAASFPVACSTPAQTVVIS